MYIYVYLRSILCAYVTKILSILGKHLSVYVCGTYIMHIYICIQCMYAYTCGILVDRVCLRLLCDLWNWVIGSLGYYNTIILKNLKTKTKRMPLPTLHVVQYMYSCILYMCTYFYDITTLYHAYHFSTITAPSSCWFCWSCSSTCGYNSEDCGRKI